MNKNCANCGEPINLVTETGFFDNGKFYCLNCCCVKFNLRGEINQRKIIEALQYGKLNYTQLREKTGLTNPTLAKHVKALRKKRTIRFNHPKDKRQKIYSLVKESVGGQKSGLS